MLTGRSQVDRPFPWPAPIDSVIAPQDLLQSRPLDQTTNLGIRRTIWRTCAFRPPRPTTQLSAHLIRGQGGEVSVIVGVVADRTPLRPDRLGHGRVCSLVGAELEERRRRARTSENA